MRKKKKLKRLYEMMENDNYVELLESTVGAMSPKSKKKYEKFCFKFGRLCKQICKTEGWVPKMRQFHFKEEDEDEEEVI